MAVRRCKEHRSGSQGEEHGAVCPRPDPSDPARVSRAPQLPRPDASWYTVRESTLSPPGPASPQHVRSDIASRRTPTIEASPPLIRSQTALPGRRMSGPTPPGPSASSTRPGRSHHERRDPGGPHRLFPGDKGRGSPIRVTVMSSGPRLVSGVRDGAGACLGRDWEKQPEMPRDGQGGGVLVGYTAAGRVLGDDGWS